MVFERWGYRMETPAKASHYQKGKVMTAQNPTPDDLRTIANNMVAERQTSRAEVLRNAARTIESLRKDNARLREAIVYTLDGFDVSTMPDLMVYTLTGDTLKRLAASLEEK